MSGLLYGLIQYIYTHQSELPIEGSTTEIHYSDVLKQKLAKRM